MSEIKTAEEKTLTDILYKYKDIKPKEFGDFMERCYPVSAVIKIVEEYKSQSLPIENNNEVVYKWVKASDENPTKAGDYFIMSSDGNDWQEDLMYFDGEKWAPNFSQFKCESWLKEIKPVPQSLPDKSFQDKVYEWLIVCFGEKIANDKVERNHRFLEESLELVQSLGCAKSEAIQLVDYVFDREIGEPEQELGGVMVTLAALCPTNNLNMNEAAEIELARIWTKVDKIREKQANKPSHSPLPQSLPVSNVDGHEAALKSVGYSDKETKSILQLGKDINSPMFSNVDEAAENMTKEKAYEQATLELLGNDPNGTRQDVIYRAMDIYAGAKKEATGVLNSTPPK